jgi:hypothetical protein
MSTPLLATRRANGEAARDHYCRANGYSRLAREEALIDLMTDLRHWALQERIDFDRALEHSSFHFDAEVQP